MAILAIAAVMIAATTIIPTHDAFAKKKKGWYKKYSDVKVGETESESVQAADLSQNVAFGPGATGNTATSTPTNTQDQTTNTGASFVG